MLSSDQLRKRFVCVSSVGQIYMYFRAHCAGNITSTQGLIIILNTIAVLHVFSGTPLIFALHFSSVSVHMMYDCSHSLVGSCAACLLLLQKHHRDIVTWSHGLTRYLDSHQQIRSQCTRCCISSTEIMEYSNKHQPVLGRWKRKDQELYSSLLERSWELAMSIEYLSVVLEFST